MARRALPSAAHTVRAGGMPGIGSSGTSRRLEVGQQGLLFPSSTQQEALWFIHQLEPSSCAYNVTVAATLIGELDELGLQWSLRELVERHESLRTHFRSSNEAIQQLVSPEWESRLEIQDANLGHLETVEVRAKELTDAEYAIPFDLSQGPLFRATLYRFSRYERLLLLSMHHIVTDGWSVELLLDDLSKLYGRFSTRASDLPSLSIQYGDFAVWDRNRTAGDFKSALDFWRACLAEAPDRLLLATDLPRRATQTFNGRAHYFVVTHALASLSRRLRVTPFVVGLACFAVVMARYSGQRTVVIGTAMANRSRPEVHRVAGYFANALPIRIDVERGLSFGQLVQLTKAVVLQVQRYDDVPLGIVTSNLPANRAADNASYFQLGFSLRRDPLRFLRLPGIVASPIVGDQIWSRLDLELELIQRDRETVGLFSYNSDLFLESTASRMVRHWTNLLEAAALSPDSTVASLPLLSAEERHEQVSGLNDRAIDTRSVALAPELFDRAVQLAPDAVAVNDGGQLWSYRDLDVRVDHLARWLLASGVRPEGLVCIDLERSIDFLIAQLAVWRAGAAYLPLNSAIPEARLLNILEDAQPQALVKRRRDASNLFELTTPIPVMDLEDLIVDGPTMSHASRPRVSSRHIAYVIYTSGSTGKPKGVVVEHAALVNFVAAAGHLFQPKPGLRVLQFFPFTFDASLLDLAVGILAGATMFLRPSESLVGDALADFLERNDIELAVVTPSVLATLPMREFPSLATLAVGGEVLNPSLSEIWSAKCSFYNMYGPTEATVACSAHRCLPGQGPTLGWPLRNCRLYVLDDRLEPVPIGVNGALYVGGEGLARGYLNDPALTASRFLPDPFGTAGARMFSTGDLGRMNSDGTIQFVGRADNQVKVRGFRVELEEVEHVLKKHPGVRQTAVLTRVDSAGANQIVAYVAVAGTNVTAATLRQFAADYLPAYMVPASFVLRDTLPLTAHQKVDRATLKAFDIKQSEQPSEPAPSNSLEESIAQIWSELLDTGEASTNQSFFELGGHSLLLTHLQNRIRETLGVEIPLSELFEGPTVLQIADRIRASQSVKDAT